MMHQRAPSPHRAPTRRSTVTAALWFLPLTSACYTFSPIEPANIQPGMSVRARIAAAAGERIAPLLGVSDARLLTGTLIAVTNDTLLVEVPTAASPDATAVGQILHQRISLARSDVRELESRRLDRKRTGLVVGAGAALLVTLLLEVMHGDPASSALPGGPGTENIIPLLLRR